MEFARRNRRDVSRNSVVDGPCIYVRVGDTVKIVCPTFGEVPKVIIGKVVHVRKRPGFNLNTPPIRLKPLLQVAIEGSDEVRAFDNGYVTEVQKRADVSLIQPNRFRDELERDPGMLWRAKTEKKGILCGTLVNLTVLFLARMSIALENEINYEKLSELFKKQRLGVVKQNGSGFWVRAKVFRKWVEANATRICCNTADKRRKETATQDRISQEYWRGLDLEYEMLNDAPSTLNPGPDLDDPALLAQMDAAGM